MNKRFNDLQLHQTDAMLAKWREAQLSTRPKAGWVHAIRDSLGMTAVALARHIGITPGGVSQLEKAESHDAITLASLRKLASALDCELQYALVPRTSLEKTLENRALQVARERLRSVSHSMSLEDQAVDPSSADVQVKLLAKEILEGSRRELWK